MSQKDKNSILANHFLTTVNLINSLIMLGIQIQNMAVAT